MVSAFVKMMSAFVKMMSGRCINVSYGVMKVLDGFSKLSERCHMLSGI